MWNPVLLNLCACSSSKAGACVLAASQHLMRLQINDKLSIQQLQIEHGLLLQQLEPMFYLQLLYGHTNCGSYWVSQRCRRQQRTSAHF